MKKLFSILALTFILMSCEKEFLEDYSAVKQPFLAQAPVSNIDSGEYKAYYLEDNLNQDSVIYNNTGRQIVWQHMNTGQWKASPADVQFQEILRINVRVEALEGMKGVEIITLVEESCVFITCYKNGELVDVFEADVFLFIVWKKH